MLYIYIFIDNKIGEVLYIYIHINKIMELIKVHKRSRKNPKTRIKRRKINETSPQPPVEEDKIPAKVEEPGKLPNPNEESKSSASSDKQEDEKALMELLRETENFDRAKNEISPFINDPVYVDIICPANNYARNIPLDESRPCSYSVRKQHYENMLRQYSKRDSQNPASPPYYTDPANLGHALIEYFSY